MRLKLFLLLALFATLPMLAQHTGVQGVVIDAKSGLPVAGATVMLDNQGNAATTGTDGVFIIDDAYPGTDQLLVLAYGYKDWETTVAIVSGTVERMGTIQVEPLSFESAEALEYRSSIADMALTESQLEDEEGNTQEVALLSGATDNPFYQAASYTFSTARFRIRGYENQKTETYINAIPFNDGIRFAFNYSFDEEAETGPLFRPPQGRKPDCHNPLPSALNITLALKQPPALFNCHPGSRAGIFFIHFWYSRTQV